MLFYLMWPNEGVAWRAVLVLLLPTDLVLAHIIDIRPPLTYLLTVHQEQPPMLTSNLNRDQIAGMSPVRLLRHFPAFLLKRGSILFCCILLLTYSRSAHGFSIIIDTGQP